MTQYTRNLTFETDNLGTDTTLVLTFDDIKNSGGHESVFPVVWRVGSFTQSGRCSFRVRYQPEFGFICGLAAPMGIVNAYAHINPGEKTILTEGGNPPAHSFSTPSHIQPPTNQMVAENDARDKVDIGFGVFDRSDRPPAQTLFFEHVDRWSSVQVEQLTPTLLGYISSDYKEGEILRNPIPFPVIFKENLAALEKDTYWKLEVISATGEYKITRVR